METGKAPRDSSQALAEQVGAAMMANDASSRFLGVTLEAIGPGCARLAMTVTADMLNALGLCHGGFTFKLADDAFAYACNSYNRNAVGISCTVSYPASARLGDQLVAEATEVLRKGRTGIYDVTVANQAGEVVLLFRGQCRLIEGRYLPAASE